MPLSRQATRAACAFALLAAPALACAPPRAAGVADIPLPAAVGPGVRDLSAILQPIRKKHQVPALAVAAFDSRRLLGIGAVGERRMGSGVRVTVDDRWHLGSAAKPMTAALVTRHVDRGELAFSSTLEERFRATEMAPQWRAVTIEQLLSHRGGAPGSLVEQTPNLWRYMLQHRDPTESRSVREHVVLELLKGAPPERRGELVYSNAGYMIAAAAIERDTHASWEELMRRELFEPLGMQGCGFGAAGECLDAPRCLVMSQPLGHKANGTSYYVPVAPSQAADNPPSFGPAGTVHCDLRSWGLFLQEQLRAMRGKGGASARLAQLAGSAASTDRDYALGWGIIKKRWAKGTAFFVQGSNTLHYANVWMAPQLDRIFVAVANGGSPEDFLATDDAIGVLLEAFGS